MLPGSSWRFRSKVADIPFWSERSSAEADKESWAGWPITGSPILISSRAKRPMRTGSANELPDEEEVSSDGGSWGRRWSATLAAPTSAMSRVPPMRASRLKESRAPSTSANGPLASESLTLATPIFVGTKPLMPEISTVSPPVDAREEPSRASIALPGPVWMAPNTRARRITTARSAMPVHLARVRASLIRRPAPG